jgi:hypothetical protein
MATSLLSCRRADKEQACHVRARDEQHEPNGALEHGQNAPQIPIQRIFEWLHANTPPFLRTGIFLGKSCGDAFDVGLRALHRHARLHAPDDGQDAIDAARLHLKRTERAWEPEIRIRIEHAKARRHHADDDARVAIEHHRLPQNLGIRREPRPPQPIADDDHAVAKSHLVFVRRKKAANLRLDRKRAEQRCAESRSRQSLRRFTVALRIHGALPAEHRPDGIERAILITPREVLDDASTLDRLAVASRRGPDEREAVWIRQRRTAQRRGAQHAENRRIRPDSESQHHDGSDGKARGTGENAERVTNILPECLSHCLLTGKAVNLKRCATRRKAGYSIAAKGVAVEGLEPGRVAACGTNSSASVHK